MSDAEGPQDTERCQTRRRPLARRAGRSGASSTRQEGTTRLSDFILSNLEPILAEWETFHDTLML